MSIWFSSLMCYVADWIWSYDQSYWNTENCCHKKTKSIVQALHNLLTTFLMILQTLKLSKCKQEIRYQPVIMIGLEFLFFCCLCRFLCAHFSVVLLYTLYLISLRTHAHIIAYVQTLDVYALKICNNFLISMVPMLSMP